MSTKLGWQISPAQRARLARRPTRNTAAWLDYLEGLHAVHRWTVKDVQYGIDRLERAVARDPAFALAQACLSDAYLAAAYVFMEPRTAFEKARQAAADALKCDPLLAEAHAGMAAVKFHLDWDWAGAGRDFEEAFRLNPRCTFAYDYYGWGHGVVRMDLERPPGLPFRLVEPAAVLIHEGQVRVVRCRSSSPTATGTTRRR